MNILVVDDEYLELLAVKKMLNEQGYHSVKTAENGLEALEILKTGSFNSIFLDIRMPGLNGLQLLEIIKSDWPEIVVSIVSAYGDFTYAKKAMELGAHCYLLKPFNTLEFTDTLKMLEIEYRKRIKIKKIVKQSLIERAIYSQDQSIPKSEFFSYFGFKPEVIVAIKCHQPDWEKLFLKYLQGVSGNLIPNQINGFTLFITEEKNLNQVKEKLLVISTRLCESFLYGIGCSTDVKTAYAKAIRELNDRNPSVVIKCTQYIKENYIKQLTLREVADAVHVSASHLNRLLKKETGKTFTDILLTIRISKAQELLKQDYNVDVVSDMVGFNSSAYFAVCFKKVTGLSPSQYRREVG